MLNSHEYDTQSRRVPFAMGMGVPVGLAYIFENGVNASELVESGWIALTVVPP